MSFLKISQRCTSNFFPNSISWELGNWGCEVLLITYFVRLWGLSFRHSMFVEKRGKQNLWLNCQFLRMLIFKLQFYVSVSTGNTVSKLKKGKMQNLLVVVSPLRPPNCICDKPNLFANISLCSDSSSMQYFPNHCTDSFYFWDRPSCSVESVRRLHYIPNLGSLRFL